VAETFEPIVSEKSRLANITIFVLNETAVELVLKLTLRDTEH